MINFTTTKEEDVLIDKIINRAIELEFDNVNYQDSSMDLSAVHSNDVKIDFEKLLSADDFNFIHDFEGIRQNINRNTGKLNNCFLPRFTKRD